jgi:hypothetical protein
MRKLAPVRWRWRVTAVVAALLALGALGWFVDRSWQKRRHREELRVATAFTGDAAAFESLRNAGERAVTMMEEFIRRHHRVEPAQIERDVAALDSAEPEARLLALARLTLLPERATSLLRESCGRLPAGLAREGLRRAMSERARSQKQVAGFLTGLYAEHFHRLFVVRRDLLRQDCHEISAQLFFAYAPFEQTWNMIKTGPEDLQLRFLLLRLYTGREDGALACLERFPASDVARAARQTWWPVEMEASPAEASNGAVTLAGALEGNTATHVLRIGLRAASQAGAPPEWAALDRWFRWTFVFRYREPVLGRAGVAYAENALRGLRPGGRRGADIPRERAETGLWLPEAPGPGLPGPGHCEAVRHVPASLLLPIVGMSRTEAAHWQSGTIHEWARPLFPTALQTCLHFEPDSEPPPQVFRSAEEVAPAKARKRWRRRG